MYPFHMPNIKNPLFTSLGYLTLHYCIVLCTSFRMLAQTDPTFIAPLANALVAAACQFLKALSVPFRWMFAITHFAFQRSSVKAEANDGTSISFNQ